MGAIGFLEQAFGELDGLPETLPPAAQRLDHLFAEQLALTPDAPAVQHRGQTVTYAELDRRANRIAHRLQSLGARPDRFVGLCLERSIDLVAAMLGILKAGSGYVPLDPAYPTDRLSYMLENSGAPIMLTRGALADRLDFVGTVLDLDADAALIDAMPSEAPEHGGTPDDIAYIIYTSGSTGQPKGVATRHTPVNLARWVRETFDDGEAACVAFTASVCFDPSVLEVLCTLCNGGLVIVKENILDPFTPDERPTLLQTVPSLAREMLRAGNVPDSVRVVLCGGEALKADLIRQFYALPHMEGVHNIYGPTECTVWSTCIRVPRDLPDVDPPIGHPIAGARLYVLSADRQPVATGEEGELYIAGPQLAHSYWNDAEKTASAFVPDFLDPEERMYRTGDLVRMLPSGEIEYRQRIGDQVKLRGFRIELGEIEAALLRLPNVAMAAALVKVDDRGNQRLRAYVSVDGAFDPVAARVELRQWLPRHMVPVSVAVLDDMPLGLSGKIDRGLLRTLPDAPGERKQERDYFLPVEDVIADIYEDLLGVHVTSADDDFFDLGGDSLLAVQAALLLEEVLAKPISPALMMHGSSPRQLAAAIDLIDARDEGYMTAVQPLGDAAPLFCTPDIFGRSLSFASLARRFAPHFPIHGLAIGPHEIGPHKPLVLDDLLDQWARVIRETQATGPYRICGFSFGGPLACALASRMERAGDEVHLYVIDSPLVRGLPPIGFMRRWAAYELRKSLKQFGLPTTLRMVARTRHDWLRWFLPNRPFDARDVPNWVPGAYHDTALALSEACERHTLTPFGGRALMIRCSEQPALSSFADADGALGWRDLLVGDVESLTVETSHYRLMRDPVVQVVAQRLLPPGATLPKK